jgi:hypothetical protein
MRVDNALIHLYGNTQLAPTRKEVSQKPPEQQQAVQESTRALKKNMSPSVNNALREQVAKNYSQAQQQHSDNSYRSQRALNQYTATSQVEERSRITEMLGIDDYA